MQRPLVVVNALKLHEGPVRTLGGNFQHVLRLSEALVESSEFDIRLLTDRVSHPVFASRMGAERLVYTGICGDSVIEADYTIARYIRKLRPKIFHRPTGQLPLFPLPCLTVASIADLSFRALPMKPTKRLYKELSYWWTLRLADHTTCVSEFTQQEIIKQYGTSVKRLSVVHHGASILQSPAFDLRDSIGSPYWLTFGHQSHKNVETCLLVLKRRQLVHKINEKLVVVGHSYHIEHVLRPLVTQLQLENSVRFVGKVNEPNLRGLYEGALALLFLSRYEGFGLPVLEAMGCGCPVIASNVCSLPEVGGDAMLSFDPDDTDGIANAMHEISSSPYFRDHLIERGYIRVTNFTWKRAAAETLAVYRMLTSLNRTPFDNK